VESIAQVVADARRANLDATERSVFGTAEPTEIADIVMRFCEANLAGRPMGARFYRSSVGCVIGLGFESGHDVVMKAYQPRWRPSFLAAVHEAQRCAATGGLPCARPLLPPTPLALGLDTFAVVESWLPDPGMHAVASDAALAVSAAGLARQVSLCSTLTVAGDLRDHPLRNSGSGLYGEPHSPHFDFASSAARAGWIDALARRAVAIRDTDVTQQVVGHTDWSARNVRLDEERLLAIYDWDSVALVAESTAVGQAAITWRVTAEPGGTAFPSVAEVARYITAYEDAAGYHLSASQWRAAGAAAAYLLAYTARCELSLEAAGIERTDNAAARDRLAESGEGFLAMGTSSW
jgi:aminoglycoside phosphotransferase (APT) family kinase protein